jgi:hypothetical protein
MKVFLIISFVIALEIIFFRLANRLWLKKGYAKSIVRIYPSIFEFIRAWLSPINPEITEWQKQNVSSHKKVNPSAKNST